MNKDSEHIPILLVDDDEKASANLIRALKRRGGYFTFHTAASAAQALELAAALKPSIAVVDLSLDSSGPASGLKLIGDLQDATNGIRIIVLTGHGADEYGINALERGAASFLEKPADAAHLHALLKDAVCYAALRKQYLELSTSPSNANALLGLSSRNAAMQGVIESAAFAASTNQPLLITGETGTGKGVLARAIHRAGQRKAQPFIRFQPAFSGRDMVGSELFGHCKGAFTGAVADRAGLIEDAHGGTLFIDEIGDLPQETQVLLLHVLQEKTFRRIGSNKEIRSDFRMIAATNKSIEEMFQQKLLRHDFFHRIAHLTIEMPALRQRVEDIADLCSEFLSNLTNRENLIVQTINPQAMQKLKRYSWPGNVRELLAVVESAVYRANFNRRRIVEPEDIVIRNQPETLPSFQDEVRKFERRLVLEALERCNNNQTKAAESLKLNRNSFRRILERDRD